MKLTNTPAALWLLLAGGAFLAAAPDCRADYATDVLAQKPINYWRLNETGPVPPDILATNIGTFGSLGNGTYVGNIRGLPGALAGDPANTCMGLPNVNGGLGGTSRVRIPWQAELNTDGAFSVEFWAKPAITSATACPASSVDFNATTRYGWLFYQGPSGLGDGNGWFFRLYHSAGNSFAAVSLPIDTSHWYHVVGTYDGAGNIKLYVDGVQVATATLGGTYTPNTSRTDVPMTFGGRGDGAAGNYGWGGNLDEVAYYTNALTAEVILAHYQNATNASPSTPYATVVQASKPAVYLRLNEAPYVPLAAVNLGSRGTAANGVYVPAGVVPAAGMRPPAFPGLENSNNDGLFDGTVGSINCGTNASLGGTTDFSVMAWIKTTATAAGTIIQQREPDGVVAGYNGEYMVTVNADGMVQFMVYKDDYQFDFATTTPVNDGAWHQVVAVRKGLDGYIYIDGAVGGSSTGTTVRELVPNISTFIGRDMRDFITPFAGEIDEVAVFDKALGQGAVQTLYYSALGSIVAPVMVTDPPTVSPEGTIYTTTSFRILADVAGTPPLTYQWRQNGTVVGTDPEYYKASAALTDNGNYDVIVRNAYGSVTSSVVALSVNPAKPPQIVQQPVSRSTYAGGRATFTVQATGTAPLRYQWKKAGVDMAGQTNSTLVLTNVTSTDAVAYSVGVSNVAGGLVSQSATLSLRTPAAGSYEAAAAASGPMVYWRLDEKTGSVAVDYAGGRDGIVSNGVTLGSTAPVPPQYPGFESANSSFEFNGTDGFVEAASLGLSGPLTVAAWVKPNTVTGDRGIVSENASWAFKLSGSEIRFTTPGILDHTTSGANVAIGVWQHVAATFTPGAANGAKFYLNGQLIGSVTASAMSRGSANLWISKNQWSGQIFDGAIDEVVVYDKVLTGDAIAGLYAAAAYGANTAPFITAQPVAPSVVLGKPASFWVGAAGSMPLSYQWTKDGSPIAGATQSSYSLAAASYADVGSYSVTITNLVGATNSAAVAVAVQPVPTFAFLTNDLVLHLRFDGTYGDASGKGNDASAPNGNPGFLAGKVGQGVHIATTPNNNYLVVGNTSGDLVFDEATSFSVGFWIKYTTGFNDVPIIGNAVNSTYQLGWVFTDQGGKIECSLVSTANSGTYVADPVSGSPLINDDAWHQVLGTVDRVQQVAAVYVDGALAGSWSIAGLGTLEYGNALTIGQDPNGGYGSATFDLDDLGIWRRVLTAYEALSIYGAAGSGQSFDVLGPVKVSLVPVGATLMVAWQAGTLEATDDLSSPGSWAAVAGASAPNYLVSPGAAKKFYRVRLK